jgi:hypothetical protein
MTRSFLARGVRLVFGVAPVVVIGCASSTDATPHPAAPVPPAVAVAIPSRAGPVDGKTENSDQFMWELFAQFTAPASAASATPVVFETWASDADTFSTTPHWPTQPEPLRFHRSVLQRVKEGEPTTAFALAQIDVPCAPPPGAAVAGFPTAGTPTPCISEQVARNHSEYDYIVKNGLNTRAGLAAAYKSGVPVDMPVDSLSLKGDWVPVQTLLLWIPSLGSVDDVRKLYYTTTSDSIEYALLSMHVASRQNPNWVWGTFEHEMNPGRCDYMGCWDSFGATVPAVPADEASRNTQYGPCEKTPELQQIMASAHLSPVWAHYCLKSSQVDFSAGDGTPYVLGNSVIEGIVGNGTIAASSCIACHQYASFGANGQPSAAAKAILPFNPTGAALPAVLAGSRTYSFNWGVLLAP